MLLHLAVARGCCICWYACARVWLLHLLVCICNSCCCFATRIVALQLWCSVLCAECLHLCAADVFFFFPSLLAVFRLSARYAVSMPPVGCGLFVCVDLLPWAPFWVGRGAVECLAGGQRYLLSCDFVCIFCWPRLASVGPYVGSVPRLGSGGIQHGC